MCSAFALGIVADGEGPAYPGVSGHEPDIAKGRKAANAVHRCMTELRAVAGSSRAYVSEASSSNPIFSTLIGETTTRGSPKPKGDTIQTASSLSIMELAQNGGPVTALPNSDLTQC